MSKMIVALWLLVVLLMIGAVATVREMNSWKAAYIKEAGISGDCRLAGHESNAALSTCVARLLDCRAAVAVYMVTVDLYKTGPKCDGAF